MQENKLYINKKILAIIMIPLIILLFIFIINNKNREEEILKQERYDSLPILVDITVSSYFGNINNVLNELDLDFDLVTMGANCYTGVQKNEFDTEKYGTLYTEFRFCKSNYTMVFRVYNKEEDQELRPPKNGELKNFDSWGSEIKDVSM